MHTEQRWMCSSQARESPCYLSSVSSGEGENIKFNSELLSRQYSLMIFSRLDTKSKDILPALEIFSKSSQGKMNSHNAIKCLCLRG